MTGAAVTVEAAFAIASLVAVLVLGVGGLSAVGMQIRCIDAAREAARLAARGEGEAATAAARRVAPSGAVVHVGQDGGLRWLGSVRPRRCRGSRCPPRRAAVTEPGVG